MNLYDIPFIQLIVSRQNQAKASMPADPGHKPESGSEDEQLYSESLNDASHSIHPTPGPSQDHSAPELASPEPKPESSADQGTTEAPKKPADN